jgi:hypothetical protein
MNIIKHEICTCHNCKQRLGYTWGQNIFNGGPWYCDNCGVNVTKDIYGEKPLKKQHVTIRPTQQ